VATLIFTRVWDDGTRIEETMPLVSSGVVKDWVGDQWWLCRNPTCLASHAEMYPKFPPGVEIWHREDGKDTMYRPHAPEASETL
jgi:hypothetical protein